MSRRALRDPEKAVEAERLLAEGHSQRQVAKALSVGNGTVARFSQDRRDRIEELREQIQATAAERVLERIEEATEAQMTAASDPACKHGPQAYRAALEGVGLSGKGGAHVHIGDHVEQYLGRSYHQHVHIEMMAPEDRKRRLAELKEELGF